MVGALTNSENPRNYWNMLKARELENDVELYTNCVQLKLQSSDGKYYKTDCANLEGMFRIIQSIPSKKAEPFKLWLARVGYQRIEENYDPELAITRALQTYLKKGYSKEWINQRLRSIEIRKELTDEWQRSGMDKPSDFASLTNTLTKAWSDRNIREYKDLKGLKKENLRDNMTNTELVLNMLAEVSTTEISKVDNPKGFIPTENVTKKGGTIAGNARKELEKAIGESVITSDNYFSEKKKLEEKQKILEECLNNPVKVKGKMPKTRAELWDREIIKKKQLKSKKPKIKYRTKKKN